MKTVQSGRFLITPKDIAFLTHWSLPKCREYIRTAKEELGLGEKDLLTICHLSQKLKVSRDELENKLGLDLRFPNFV